MGLFDVFKKKKPKEKGFVPIREPRRMPTGLPRLGGELPSVMPTPELRPPAPPEYGRLPRYEGSRLDVVETQVRTILSELDSIKAELREIRSKLDILVGRERSYRY